MKRQDVPAPVKTITGFILPESRVIQSNQDDLSESEDEEEEKQPEFLDMKEMDSVSSGGQMFEHFIPASKEVDFMAGDKKYRIEGRFPLCDPWWSITCTVREGHRKFYVKGFPSYSLRTDLRSEGRSIVSLFLTACEAFPDFVYMFMEWLPKDRHVEPANVIDALLDFEKSKLEHKAIAEQLMSRVNHSVAGTRVKVASMYPGIMKYIPTLLPGQFVKIISEERMKPTSETPERENSTQPPQPQQNNTDVWAKLEELIKTDVWKLGFNYIMFKELRLIRCEAKFEAFKLCNLFGTIPELQQNALLLYTEIKHYCRTTGSTYIHHEKLEEWMGCELVWKAGRFLEEQGVLKRERKKVALQNLFGYENGIAGCLRSLVEGEPWRIQLDVREVLRKAHRKNSEAKTCEKDNTNTGVGQSPGPEQEDLADVQPGSLSMDHSGITCSDLNEFSLLNPNQDVVNLDPDQVRAAEMMCANPVTVISGKGGCGKTTVVSLVFKAAMQQQTCDREEVMKACEIFQNDSQGSSNGLVADPPTWKQDITESKNGEKPLEVLLTAPTGRAASLLTKRTSFPAFTMHQVLWSFMNAEKDSSGKPKVWKFSKVRVLVVDEGSLVSVQILHSLLSMLTKHAQLQKFVLLGDVRQLPSIEPGNTLCDLFEGLRNIHWAVEMRTNHRAESELIVRNAGLIAEMGKKKRYSPLEFDATIDMTKPSAISSNKSFIFVQISGENYNLDLQNAIIYLLKQGPGLQTDTTSQFVAFRRKDCDLINDLCCKHYSQHITKNHKKEFDFQRHDKVCCTKNGYVIEKDSEAPQPSHHVTPQMPKLKLCNGEIFFITDDVTEDVTKNVTEENVGQRRRKKRYLTLDDKNGQVVTSCFRQLQRECKLRHAWARTIHTFQGSEAETIVYVLGDSTRQNWQHIYTAVTRGQKRVYVVGTETNMEKAINKRVIPRKTRLGGLVRKVVAQSGSEGEETLIQSGINESPLKTQDYGPLQFLSKTLHTSSLSQAFCSTISSCKHLSKDSEASNKSLHEDMTFSGTYSWSPMNLCDGSNTVQNENVSELSDPVGELRANSSTPDKSSRPAKRVVEVDDCMTPSKLPKQTPSEESPLGSSKMKLLSISSPSSRPSRQLFHESSSHGKQP